MLPYLRDYSMNDAIAIRTYERDDFSGGLCNRKSPITLNPNQAADILNMAFVSNNLVEKRQGTHNLDALVLSSPITYMDIYRPINEAEVLIRATATEVYAGLVKICDVTGSIQGLNYAGNYYFVDGSKLRQYDGENVYEITEPAHSYLSINYASGVSSIVITDWDVRIATGQPMTIEGLYFDTVTISTINATTKTITFTPALSHAYDADTFVRFFTPNDDSYIDGAWKTDETLKTKWYEPCNQELNDVWKGECVIPTSLTCMCFDSQRVYLAGDKDSPHTIYISDIDNPFYFPTQLTMQCPPNGDKIVDLVNFEDSVIAGRTDDIHVISGSTNNTTLANFFELKRFNTHTGFSSINNAKSANNYLFYLGSDMSVYAMNSSQYSQYTLATTMLNKDTIDLTKAPLEFTPEQCKNAPSIFFQNEYWIAIGDRILIYNYNNRAWTVYKGMNATYFLIKDDALLIGTSTGKIMTHGGEYNDDGLAINAYYKTGDDNLGYPILYKDFLDMFAETHVYDNEISSITLLSLIDYMDAGGTYDIATQISRFGVTTFGEMLISRKIAQTDYIPVDARGRTFGFMYQNNVLNEPIKLYRLTATFKIRNTR